MRGGLAAALSLVVLVAAGCGGVVSPSQNKTEEFTGTIAPGGRAVHPFTASAGGEYSVLIASLTPVSNIFVGTVFGQALSDGSCQVIQQNNLSVVNNIALTGTIVKGNFCVAIYDVGAFTTTETYTLKVSHP